MSDKFLVTPTFGFELIDQLHAIKLKLAAAGYEGRVKLLQALMATGVHCSAGLLDSVVAIVGEAEREGWAFLLEEATNEHWTCSPEGEYHAIQG